MIFRKLKNIIGELKYVTSKNGFWSEYIQTLNRNHFLSSENLTDVEKLSLFKNSVDLVEIEPHSFCNRICPFCPNYKLDRLKNNHEIDNGIFDKILEDLSLISYDNLIRFALYSEPLSSPNIIHLVRSVRNTLPKCEIDIITNGDYLDEIILKKLIGAGLNTLWISIYPKKYQWTRSTIINRINEISIKLNITPEITFENKNEISWLFPNNQIKIFATGKNYTNIGFDRGGALNELTDDKFTRDSPCRMVFNQFTVYNDGAVVPCCNIRNDYSEHKKHIVDVLDGKKSIFDIYCSKFMVSWRKELTHVGSKKGPCSSCKQHICDYNISKNILERKIKNKLFEIH